MTTSVEDETRRIDPSTVELPPAFADRVRELFDLDTTPETYGDWARMIVETFEEDTGGTLSTSDLCDTADSPHTATLAGETTHYMCAQDPLVVGMLADEPVTVESTPPNREEPITVSFEPDGTIEAAPDGALLSFGVDPDAERPEPVTPEAMYRLVCPYGHAFPDDEAYREWASEADAVTDALSVPAGIAVMRALIGAAGVDALAEDGA